MNENQDVKHIEFVDEPENQGYAGQYNMQQEGEENGKKFIDENLNQINTLEEPVTDTLLRDLKMVGIKLRYVLLPSIREDHCKELRNWDLWGPLLICVMMSLVLSINTHNTPGQSASQVFTLVFGLIWAGAILITLNIKCLGTNISIFQSVCVIGYCIFPISIATLFGILFKAALPFFLRLIIAGVACAWSTLAAGSFITSIVPAEKKILALYPCGLFYMFLAFVSALA